MLNKLFLSKESQCIRRSITALCFFTAVYISVSLFLCSNSKYTFVTTSARVGISPTIIIDPGHGGVDGGASSLSGVTEKDVNLKISGYIRDYCSLSGIKCVMTRNDDIMLTPQYSGSSNKKRADLIARVEIASQYDNPVFVSIHQNKFDVSKYRGLQVFYSKNSPESIILANIIRDSNREMLSPDNEREVKPAGSEIYVLDNIKSPAVLVECGFLSNAAEAEMLNSDEYQRKIAFMIYTSLMKYFYKA